MGKNEGVSKVNQRGLKAQKHIAQGSALGSAVLPLRGVSLTSFDTPSKSYLISTRNVDAGSFAPFTRLARVNGCHP